MDSGGLLHGKLELQVGMKDLDHLDDLCTGIPQWERMFLSVVLLTESKAFSKLMKTAYSCELNFMDCSTTILRIALCSLHDLLEQKPGRLSLSLDSEELAVRLSILLTTERNIKPHQFLHWVRSPFSSNLMIIPFCQSREIFSCHTLLSRREGLQQTALLPLSMPLRVYNQVLQLCCS